MKWIIKLNTYISPQSIAVEPHQQSVNRSFKETNILGYTASIR